MAASVIDKRKYNLHTDQLYFSFVSSDKKKSSEKPLVRGPGRPRKKKLTDTVPTTQQPSSNNEADFKQLCLVLYDLACRHVSRSEFADFNTLVRCTKLFNELGLAITPSDALNAHVAAHSAILVIQSPQYRLLRNQAIAGLATIADLATKAPGKGSGDYQRGMRDAFEQAGDIAAIFLEEFLEKYDIRTPAKLAVVS